MPHENSEQPAHKVIIFLYYTLVSIFKIIFSIDLYILHFRSPLTKIQAERARDNLSKGLYENLFSEMIRFINDHFSHAYSEDSIGILDVAGFGGFEMFPI